VVDSRIVGEGEQIRRRRECLSCKDRFTTYETVELSLPRLVKKDGSFVQFKPEKLRSGILRACEKRPVSTSDIDSIIAKVMRWMSVQGERELPTRKIGEYVMDELRYLDEVAYVRFASVYRHFQDAQEFRDEVTRMRGDIELEKA
jgi:transcriptional repressor NrdR